MATIKRWPIGLQSSTTGDPQGIGQVIKDLTQNGIAMFSASTDSFSILTDLQIARENNPEVPNSANFTPTGFVDGYHLNVPVFGQPAGVELGVRHWNKVQQQVPIHDPARSPIKWQVPCIWMSTWNEVRPYVGWAPAGQPTTPADQPVEGYEGNADLIGWQAVEIGKEAVKRGYRWAAFGFAGGDPEEGFWDAPGVLAYLRLCQEFPDQLGIALHEYSHEMTILNRPHKIGRFKHLHDACDRHGIRRPVIQIKEFGWRDIKIPEDKQVAIAELIEVARMYMEHPNIHGAAIWTVQKWQNSGIDQQVRGLIPLLRDAALAHAQPIKPLAAPPVVVAPPVAPPVVVAPPAGGGPAPAAPPAGQWPFAILAASPAEAADRLTVATTDFGIDVSLHQEDRLNWSQLQKDGVRFAFLRVGSGHQNQDHNYIRNVAGCLKNDIPFGNYFTLFEDVDIEQQARMYVHHADWRATLPPVVNIERSNLTAAQIKTFVDEFQRLVDGPPIMILTRASLWNTIVPKSQTWPAGHPLWVSEFGVDRPDLPHHWDRWVFFQPGFKKGLAGYPPRNADDPVALSYNHFNGAIDELIGLEPATRARPVAFNDYIPFDSPVGTAEQRRRREPLYPGQWIDVNPHKTLYTNPSTNKDAYHTGADLNLPADADAGQPIYAAADGVVSFAGQKDVWGGLIVIKHSPTLFSRYGHVADMKVVKDQAVVRGQQIAQIGQDAFGGPFHLHFDISQTDVLANKPEHWPGLDLDALVKHYVNPTDYIDRHRPQDTDPPASPRLGVPTRFATVTATAGLNLRSEPGTEGGEATIKARLDFGTKVGVYSYLNNGWAHVRVGNMDGFVFAEFISDLPVPVTDTTRFRAGMNLNPDAPHSNPVDSDVLKGIDWVRFVFKVDARPKPEERGDITKAFAQYDAIIKAYDQMGIGTLLILNQETLFGKPGQANPDWPTYAARFATMAGQIAAHYQSFGGRVAYEIWNEGDLKENNPSIFLEPADYATLLKPTAAAIRAASPGSPIIFGGLASGAEKGVNYVKQTRAALGGSLPVDAIGIHPYGRWISGPPFPGWGFGTLKDSLEFWRLNLPGETLWITEIGIPGGDNELGPEHYPAIAKYFTELHQEVATRYPDLVPVLVWFAWSDNMQNAGIVRGDGAPKAPIFDAFRQVRERTLFA